MPAILNTPTFALVGPPNAGKTTLFNALTGANNHAVNYPGATVEYAVGHLKRQWGPECKIADTPGTYSLSPKSPEEQVTFDLLTRKATFPTAVIVVVDGLQLSRHLPLVRHVRETGLPLAVAVTMKDLVEKDGRTIDIAELSRLLGVPVIAINAVSGEGIDRLVATTHSLKPSSAINTPQPWSTARQSQELTWAAQITSQVYLDARDAHPLRTIGERTARLDHVLLHRFLGPLLFVIVMTAVFTSIFWLAAPAMDFVTGYFESLATRILEAYPGSLIADFIGSGLVLSVGAVMTFVPQIVILFLGITLLEDSGYLARAATLIDRPLSRLGLNGRSFVPLLSGYACAIPAMLAARTIPNRKERWITLFILPLMSCSARLPVYALLLAYLFAGSPAWKPGLALAGIYVFSLVVGALAAALVNRLIKSEEHSFFLLELPVYRRPSLRGALKNVYLRTESYLRKAGPAIFAFSVALWVATTFPNYKADNPNDKLKGSYAAQLGQVLDPVMHPMGGDWRTGVALVSAFAAREVFVSSLGLVMQVSEQNETNREVSLLESMRIATRADGSPLFTVASAVGLILFFMIALQCMSTVAVARREFGNWKYPLIQLVAFNIAAYVLAVGAVQGLRAFGIA